MVSIAVFSSSPHSSRILAGAMTAAFFITGTDTGVGKTITTAALAAALMNRSQHVSHREHVVAVDKPTQTGVTSDEAGDIQEIQRLAGVRFASEGIRLKAAMAPVAA